jgi:hypothetical protein
MQQITVGFSRPNGWFEPFSWLIRLAYWSPFSHSYIKYSIEEMNLNVIIQASGLVINLIGETVFDSKEIIYKEFTLPISDADKLSLVEFGLNQLGKPYNVLGIFGMAWVRFGQLVGLKLKSPFKYNQSSAFCSELVAYMLKNFDNVKISNVSDLSPKDVYNIVSNINVQSISQS